MRADSLRNEAAFLPRDVDDLATLRRKVIDQGHAPSVANGLVGWLVSKAAGEPDLTGAPTRARYRRILEQLAGPGGPGGRGRRRARRPGPEGEPVDLVDDVDDVDDQLVDVALHAA